MRKRISRTIFWLTVLSVASGHNILLGLVLYPIAAATVLIVFLSPFFLAFGAWLLWYRLRHHRLPGWLLPERLPAWLVGVTPRRLRRRLRRRWPRPPRPHEAPTAEMPAVTSAANAASPAGELAGQAAGSHVA
jgi:hypothetical protein